MERYTQEEDGRFYVMQPQIRQQGDRFVGDAVDRLAAYEAVHAQILAEQAVLTEKLARMRAENQTKTARFREDLGKKLVNSQLLGLLQAHGLE